MEIHAQRRPIADLLKSLHEKFATNIEQLQSPAIALLEDIDLHSRAVDGLSTELIRCACGTDAQKLECSRLLNEVFADFSVAMYLLSVGLIVPARMLTRRAFELGLGAVYMWDLPHKYWGWAKHDHDLGFTEMIEHLTSQSYLTHLANVQGKSVAVFPCKAADLQKLYRSLSNTVHGKLDGLPPLSPERYSPTKNNMEESLRLELNVQKTLITIWLTRFPELNDYLEQHFPNMARR